MARGKKKEGALTPEEKLARALVPESEQPYKVPENWCWVRLPETFENYTDSKKKVQQKTYLENGKLAVVDQGQELIGGYTDDERMAYCGNLPVVVFGDHTRCIKYIDFHFAQGADGVKVLRPKSFYTPKAFYYSLQAVDIPNMGYRRHFPLFDQYAMPLPPLPEQQRIVDRIESLFAKLDEAKEKAQTVLDSFGTRKAAILHKAFTGELTAKWRAEHGVSVDTWAEKPLADFLQLITYGFTNPMPDADDGPWKITAKSVHDGYIDYTISRKTTQDAFDNLLTDKSRPLVNDVLLTKDGSIGRVAVVDRPGICINQSVALLRPTKEVLPEFLRDMLLSPQHQKTMELQAGGTALKHIYITRVDKMLVSVPSLEEQEEICRIIDKLLDKEQQAKEAAETVLEQIDLMKRSILARAFRGELGTNDPAEESAVELVKTVVLS